MEIKNLFDLSRERSFKECVVFYFACLLIIELFFFISFFVICILQVECSFELVIKMGNLIAAAACTFLAAAINTKKKMWASFRANLLFVLAILSSLMGGALLGMIPVCMLCYAPIEGEE